MLQKPLQSGAYLLGMILEKKLWPEQLTTHQRRVCVRQMLHERKWTVTEIADILGVHRVTVSRDKNLIMTQDAWILDEIDTRKVAVRAIQDAEWVSAHLFREGRLKDGWAVRKELIEILQGLGYVQQKPKEIRGQISLLDILNSESEAKEKQD